MTIMNASLEVMDHLDVKLVYGGTVCVFCIVAVCSKIYNRTWQVMLAYWTWNSA